MEIGRFFFAMMMMFPGGQANFLGALNCLATVEVLRCPEKINLLLLLFGLKELLGGENLANKLSCKLLLEFVKHYWPDDGGANSRLMGTIARSSCLLFSF